MLIYMMAEPKSVSTQPMVHDLMENPVGTRKDRKFVKKPKYRSLV